MKNAMREAKKIYCVGVGGIAISGIAKLLHAQGVEVGGSDSQRSEITDEVAALGIRVAIGHAAENIPADADAVIFSEAVPPENPERLEARLRGIPEFSGADALAALTEGKRLIAVTGTNGKSTTTAMIGLILERAGLDPTVVVGSIVPGWPLGSVRAGKGEWMVIEADEYARKLLKYHPDAAVITNIEEDHMDVYRDINDIVRTFQQFVNQVNPGGFAVVNRDDPQSARLKVGNARKVEFGADDIQRTVLRSGNGGLSSAHPLTLKIPGTFNRANAAAAAACARELEIPFATVKSALEDFTGIWRRFEVLGQWRGATVVSDYAHHPTALKATLKAAHEWVGNRKMGRLLFSSQKKIEMSSFSNRRIIAVFQPHHHHRTRALFADFARAFEDADAIVLTEVYDVAGREEGERVEIAELVGAIENQYPGKTVVNGGPLGELQSHLERIIRPGDLVLFLGAGDIDAFARSLFPAK